MFAKPEVAVGDRFMKVATFPMPVWKVARIYRQSMPYHAHLEQEGVAYETITVSLPALNDPNLFRKLGKA